jgi:hypothetical protein
MPLRAGIVWRMPIFDVESSIIEIFTVALKDIVLEEDMNVGASDGGRKK